MSDIIFQEGLIASQHFQDSYFSHVDGYKETHHVFMGGNNLPARFEGKTAFTVAELGLGTGLNCLCTWDAWRQQAAGGTLTYVGFEKYPLSPENMQKALEKWPQLKPVQQALLAQPLPTSAGWHTVEREGLKLLLAIGDANDLLPAWEGKADAWYLDGFAPNRNPALWQESLLQEVFEHTEKEGSAATYSAAGHVRRGLEAAGFRIEKQAGFAQKREMVVAYK